VGSLRAVDRWIWTAVGDATNRAARLQALTRELEAETVIDESTWRGLDRERSGFYPLHRHKLRGLAQKQNLFLKPLYIPIPASAAASALSASAAPPAG
jgi:class 3 adenylate cyclase